MTKIEALFLWSAIWMYGISFTFFLFGIVFKKKKSLTYGVYLATLGLILLSSAIAFRWIETGHPPVMRTYENSLLGSWFIVVTFLVIRYWQRNLELIGAAIMPIVLMMIGNGVMGNPVLEPLSPPFKSNWLWLHVFFAWVSYAAFCVASGLGVLYLVKESLMKNGKEVSLPARTPDLPIISELILKVVIFGFLALTVQIGAGALWAYDLWGRYWGWDPIENWSLITWLTYGACIHLGVTLGWKGRRLAWLAIGALLFVFITFGGIGFLGGIHTTIL